MRRRREAKRRPEEGVLPKGQGDITPAPGHGRRGRQKIVTAALVALAVAVISLVAVSTFFSLSGPGEQSQPLTAAIVDQLSLTQPNPDFVQRATDLLEGAGFTVDYYPGDQVTVDFYRNLPLRDYALIVLRVHSGLGEETGFVSLFTSEPYSQTTYVEEQRAGRFGVARYYDGGDPYFGINPEFIESSMRGSFDKTLIIMMGCWGLIWPDMAEAFVRRGAGAVTSWDGLVSAAHTDAATEHLLRHLLTERRAIPEAVAQTMAEVGPDPMYGSSLLFYPPESVGTGPGEAYSAR